MLTPEQIAAFDRDGFVVVPRHLGNEAHEFAVAFRGLESALEGHGPGELYDTAWLMPEFLRIAGKVSTQTAAHQLLGTEGPLYLYNGRCLIQPPGDDSHCWGWHQEVFHAVPLTRMVQTWAPLICDATEDNGAIEVLPGSHQEGIARQAWTDEGTGYARVDDQVVARYQPLSIPLPVGSMLFFSGRLIHRSGKNRSAETRYAAVGVYTDVRGGFRAPKPTVAWRGKTPRGWLEEQTWD